MDKVIRNGEVAILYSPGFGAGWYTWHGLEELLFDPTLVEMVENEAGYDAIIQHCENKYLADACSFGGAEQLSIWWVPVGTKFFIDEYDGSECVNTIENLDWKVA